MRRPPELRLLSSDQKRVLNRASPTHPIEKYLVVKTCKGHICGGDEAEPPWKNSLRDAFVKLSDVMALMIEAQRALLRGDNEEARDKAADAVLILNGVRALSLT
jgi:hypothetical protein